MTKAIISILNSVGACDDAQDWSRNYNGESDYARAWNECVRGDWLLWLATKVGVDRKLVVSACCVIAEAALIAHWKRDDARPMKAIEAARAWCRGELDAAEVRLAAANAANAAADAADAAAANAAAYAANAAAYAANADAAAYAARSEARAQALKDCAVIVRKHITVELVLDGLRRKEVL